MPKYSTYNDSYLLKLMEQDDDRAFTALYNIMYDSKNIMIFLGS